MPIYKFECLESECHHRFEKLIPINEDKIVFCPICNGKTRKVIDSAPTISFIGSGFYTNDSKSKEDE